MLYMIILNKSFNSRTCQNSCVIHIIEPVCTDMMIKPTFSANHYPKWHFKIYILKKKMFGE